MKYFKREQILVVDGDAFIKDPLPELRKIEAFLGLKHKFNNKDFYFDKKKGFYCFGKSTGQRLCLRSAKGRKHPEVNISDVQKLKDYFQPFNQEFYNAVGQAFNW